MAKSCGQSGFFFPLPQIPLSIEKKKKKKSEGK
jgi:hypothetical protein